jgi:hypothetical protein
MLLIFKGGIKLSKKIISIFVSMLLFATVLVVKGNENTIDNKKIETSITDSITSFPLLSGKMAYGLNCQSTNRDLVTFDLTDPDPWTIIGQATPPATNFLSGGDFVADIWYACEYSTSNSNIYTIDETTGTLTLIGASGALLNGIAYDDSTDTLYGASSTSLYTVNKATGVATLIGAMGNAGTIIDIASDGQGHLYGEDITDDNLYSINTATGSATIIGAIGVNLAYAQDMAIDKDDGSCYNTGYKGSTLGGGALMSVNLTTGHATLIENFPIGSMSCPAEVDCFAIPYSLNEPPETPAVPSGPVNGIQGFEYTFSAVTTDPEGDQVFYMFDWGDGNYSSWVGPYASGVSGSAAYTWETEGTYDVKVKAKDTNDGESDWSPAHQITILGIALEISDISGGLFKVKTTVKNIGGSTANNINWSITATGGFILSGKETTGSILILEPGDERTVTSKAIIGFGKTVIKVTASIPGYEVSKEQNATVLLFFISIK